jgi:hypothetical protein
LQAFEHFAEQRNHPNPLSGDFGLYTEEDVDDFIRDELSRFTLILLSERYVGAARS